LARKSIEGIWKKQVKRWHQLSAKEQIDFTMNNSIKKIDNFIDDRRQTDEALYWSKKDIDNFINRIHRKESLYYGETNAFLYECLAKYPIKDKTVAILGSIKPWYEAVCLAYGGHPVTIEYNKLKTDDDRLKLMTVKEYNKNPIKFDMVMSISSIEHDGLGRYGDPIDPTGDFKAMENVRNNILKKEGLFFFWLFQLEKIRCVGMLIEYMGKKDGQN